MWIGMMFVIGLIIELIFMFLGLEMFCLWMILLKRILLLLDRVVSMMFYVVLRIVLNDRLNFVRFLILSVLCSVLILFVGVGGFVCEII